MRRLANEKADEIGPIPNIIWRQKVQMKLQMKLQMIGFTSDFVDFGLKGLHTRAIESIPSLFYYPCTNPGSPRLSSDARMMHVMDACEGCM